MGGRLRPHPIFTIPSASGFPFSTLSFFSLDSYGVGVSVGAGGLVGFGVDVGVGGGSR